MSVNRNYRPITIFFSCMIRVINGHYSGFERMHENIHQSNRIPLE